VATQSLDELWRIYQEERRRGKRPKALAQRLWQELLSLYWLDRPEWYSTAIKDCFVVLHEPGTMRTEELAEEMDRNDISPNNWLFYVDIAIYYGFKLTPEDLAVVAEIAGKMPSVKQNFYHIYIKAQLYTYCTMYNLKPIVSREEMESLIEQLQTQKEAIRAILLSAKRMATTLLSVAEQKPASAERYTDLAKRAWRTPVELIDESLIREAIKTHPDVIGDWLSVATRSLWSSETEMILANTPPEHLPRIFYYALLTTLKYDYALSSPEVARQFFTILAKHITRWLQSGTPGRESEEYGVMPRLLYYLIYRLAESGAEEQAIAILQQLPDHLLEEIAYKIVEPGGVPTKQVAGILARKLWDYALRTGVWWNEYRPWETIFGLIVAHKLWDFLKEIVLSSVPTPPTKDGKFAEMGRRELALAVVLYAIAEALGEANPEEIEKEGIRLLLAQISPLIREVSEIRSEYYALNGGKDIWEYRNFLEGNKHIILSHKLKLIATALAEHNMREELSLLIQWLVDSHYLLVGRVEEPCPDAILPDNNTPELMITTLLELALNHEDWFSDTRGKLLWRIALWAIENRKPDLLDKVWFPGVRTLLASKKLWPKDITDLNYITDYVNKTNDPAKLQRVLSFLLRLRELLGENTTSVRLSAGRVIAKLCAILPDAYRVLKTLNVPPDIYEETAYAVYSQGNPISENNLMFLYNKVKGSPMATAYLVTSALRSGMAKQAVQLLARSLQNRESQYLAELAYRLTNLLSTSSLNTLGIGPENYNPEAVKPIQEIVALSILATVNNAPPYCGDAIKLADVLLQASDREVKLLGRAMLIATVAYRMASGEKLKIPESIKESTKRKIRHITRTLRENSQLGTLILRLSPSLDAWKLIAKRMPPAVKDTLRADIPDEDRLIFLLMTWASGQTQTVLKALASNPALIEKLGQMHWSTDDVALQILTAEMLANLGNSTGFSL